MIRAMTDLKPGDWIGGEYRIRRTFGGEGRSGMGVVYLVEGRTSEDPFVLKTFQRGKESALMGVRFRQEAEAWVKLGKHANLVRCFWVKEFRDQLFVAAEYVVPDTEGKNTLALHLIGVPPPLQQQVSWVGQFCFGMRHASRCGVKAHRDIKPDNLMIDGSRVLKVTDFGLAKMLNADNSLSDELRQDMGKLGLSQRGSACGTPPFMAPEQFFDAQSVDCRADIYSFGVVLYMMISGGNAPILPGQLLLARMSPWEAWVRAHIQQTIARIDSPLMGICGRCLEKDPKRRYQSYDELLDDLGAMCRKYRFDAPHEHQEEDARMESEFTRAMALNEAGKTGNALEELRVMVKTWPKAAKIYTELGKAALTLGMLPEALEATERSVRIDGSRTAAWNNLGVILTRMNRIADAKGAFGKALLTEPENTGAMIGLAQLLLDEGDSSEARKLADLALFWRPEKTNVLKVAGICALKSGDTKAAEDVFAKLTSIDGSDARDWFNLALCFGANRKPREQIRALNHVLRINPKDAEALNVLVQVHAFASRFDEALTICEQLQQIAGWETVGTCKAAQMFAAKGDPLSGCALLKRWLAKNENNASLWLTLATVLSEMPTQRKEAKIAAENAIIAHRRDPRQLTPGSVAALEQLFKNLRESVA
jgi:serine/threonine protein kinase/cytochrome c-type biogenesis protein CcmH/NrfG